MANNTDEWWDINGVSLHQYGWSVTTLSGSRYSLPPRRGDNLKLAYRPGQIHRPKLADQRTIDLAMWVTGIDPATGFSTNDARLRFNDSWDFLRRLVWTHDGSQVDLTRRWWLTVDGVPTLVKATARAEIADTMDLSMTGRFRAQFVMNLRLADPFFYGDEVTVAFTAGQTKTVHNPGHDLAAFGSVTVDFDGPSPVPVLTNLTPEPNTQVRIRGGLGERTVRLDVGTFTAYDVADPATSFLGYVQHTGAKHWFGLVPGDNLVKFDTVGIVDGQPVSSDATATLRFRPPYI